MPRVLDPFRFVLIAVAGWMNQRQLQVIDSFGRRTGFCANNSAGGAFGLTMIGAVAWPPRPKAWDGSAWPKWRRSSFRRFFRRLPAFVASSVQSRLGVYSSRFVRMGMSGWLPNWIHQKEMT